MTHGAAAWPTRTHTPALSRCGDHGRARAPALLLIVAAALVADTGLSSLLPLPALFHQSPAGAPFLLLLANTPQTESQPLINRKSSLNLDPWVFATEASQ